jgi:hypothetical protein
MNPMLKPCDGHDRPRGTGDIVFVRYSCVASLLVAMATLPWEGRRELEEGVLEVEEACGRVNLVGGCA